MIPTEAVLSPEVQALYALCHHMPLDHKCEACKFRQQAGIAYLVNMCKGAIDSIAWK